MLGAGLPVTQHCRRGKHHNLAYPAQALYSEGRSSRTTLSDSDTHEKKGVAVLLLAMLSGLYGDLPEAKNNSSASGSSGGWASKPNFAPPARKPALGAPRSVLGAAKKRPKEPEGKTNLVPLSLAAGATVVLGKEKDERFQDEYDPARPNEYEAVRKERERFKQEAQQEVDRQEELRMAQEREAELESLREMDAMRPEKTAEEREAALSVSGEEAFLRRARLGKPGSRPAAEGPAGDAGGTFAQRMMERMGWKEGLGLGKSHQGITAPLVAQKTDHRSAVIVNAPPRAAAEEFAAAQEKRAKGVSIRGTPSRVILLRNIVGPGEVDDSLDDEIGEECSKYGQVGQITIFEVTEPGYPADQAVRIFVQFERMEAALKALIDLEGRFFGGRTVKASFFSEQRLEKQDLAPVPGHPD